MIKEQSISCIDIFCGAGGLSYGLQLGGVEVCAGFDVDGACRYPYEQNVKAPFVKEDVRNLPPSWVAKCFKKSGEGKTLLAGCAPCQPFSQITARAKEIAPERWYLLRSFSEIATSILPDFITMENVPQLEKEDVFQEFCDDLTGAGYHVSANKIFCPDYGIPQRRERLVLLASRYGPIELIEKTHPPSKYKTVRDTFKGLRALKAGESDPNDPLHKASGLSPLNLKRIQHSKPNGSWEDWPDDLVSPCHKRLRGSNFRTSYGRMAWDAPAPTVTTQCYGYSRGRFGHPEEDRAISLREAALLQTFPRNYLFAPPDSPIPFSFAGRVIGNAVPVTLGKVIAQSFTKHMRELNV